MENGSKRQFTSEQEPKLSYNYNLLIITLLDNYIAVLKSVELVYDTLYTNFLIDAAPVLVNNIKCQIHNKTSSGSFPQDAKVYDLDVASLGAFSAFLKKDFEYTIDTLSKSDLTLNQWINFLKEQLTKSTYFNVRLNVCQSIYLITTGVLMANENQHKIIGFEELVKFFTSYICGIGNKFIVHQIKKLKLMYRITVTYDLDDKSKIQKTINLRNYLKHAVPLLYNILITINYATTFLQKLPKIYKQSYQVLESFMDVLQCMDERNEALRRYCLDRNYLKKTYSQNIVNACNSDDLASFSYVDFSNKDTIVIKDMDLMMGKCKKAPDNTGTKPSDWWFPNCEEFLTSSRSLRVSNSWYLFNLLHIMKFKYANNADTTSLVNVDAKLSKLYKVNCLTFNKLIKEPKEDTNWLAQKCPTVALLTIVKGIQLPISYSVLILIIDFEWTLNLLVDVNTVLLMKLTAERYGLAKAKKNTKNGKEIGNDHNKDEDNDYDEFTDFEDEEYATLPDLFDLPKRVREDKRFDEIVTTNNKIMSCRGLFLRELSSKKILVEEFFTQLLEANGAGTHGSQTSKKPTIQKFTKREEKIIVNQFLEKIEEFFAIFNRIVNIFLAFDSSEEEKIMSKCDVKPNESFDVRSTCSAIMGSAPEISKDPDIKDNEILTKMHLQDLNLKTIGFNLVRVMRDTRKVKSKIESDLKIIDKKVDKELDSLIMEITCSVYDMI